LTAVNGSPKVAYFRDAVRACRRLSVTVQEARLIRRAPSAVPLARGHVCLCLPTSRFGLSSASTDAWAETTGNVLHAPGLLRDSRQGSSLDPCGGRPAARWVCPRVSRMRRERMNPKGSPSHDLAVGQGPRLRQPLGSRSADVDRTGDSRIHSSPPDVFGTRTAGFQGKPPCPRSAGSPSHPTAAVQEGDKQ